MTGYEYIPTFTDHIDDYTKYRWTFPMISCNSIPLINDFYEWKAQAEHETGKKVKEIRCANAAKFKD
jgi:hypothetical protein